MRKNWVLTQESFDSLLAWLDPNRDEAGRKYEDIRRRLVKIFVCRGCFEPEDLADETINRVTQKLAEIKDSFAGERARYFCGVAHKVHLEYRRKRIAPRVLPVVPEKDEHEVEFNCLEKCMEQTLTPNNRVLVVEYYQEGKSAKIEHRKKLADQLGIGLNALRIRAFRIRASLEKCVQHCVNEEQREMG